MNGKLIGKILIGLGSAAAIYFGFIYQMEDGLTAWQHLIGKKTLTREEADKILGGSVKSYGDEYVIAWALSKRDGKDSFELKGIKYSTNTGKKI